MMTKNFASNSVLRRASQFESGSSADQQQQQAQSSSRNTGSTQQSSVSIKRPSLSRRSITKPKDEVDDNVDQVTEDHHQKATKTTTTSSNDHQQQPQQNVFLSSAYARFEREYARLYPDSPAPPFTEPANTEEAAEALRRQQARAAELSLELSKAKFAANFLKGITSSSSSANADRRDSTATGNES